MNFILKNYAIVVAVVFALMDLSGLVGGIGYELYYPMVIIFAIIASLNTKSINGVYLFFLLACFFSIVLNDIPAFYNMHMRFVGYVMLFIAVTPMFSSSALAELRLKIILYFCLFTVGLVVLNFIIFRGGGLSARQMEGYENLGMYTGSTANNQMGALGAFSLIFLTNIILFKERFKKQIFYIVIPIMIISLIMMLLASSRTAIFGAFVSIISVLYVKYKNRIWMFVGAIILLGIIGYVLAPYLGEYTRGIIEFKQGGDMTEFDMKSREDVWQIRIDEFFSNPIFGIGFGTVSNPSSFTFKTGIVEASSGWLALFSQLGLFGAIPILIITIKNLLYLYSKKTKNFVDTLLMGLCVFITIQSISEAYITTVGSILCCLFWLVQGCIYSMRKKMIKTIDLQPLSFILKNNPRETNNNILRTQK